MVRTIQLLFPKAQNWVL